MNIVITGASRGIGFETAKAFAADPANKVFAIARDATKLEALREQAGKNIHPIVADLSIPDDIHKKVVRAIEENAPSVDILINNAGTLVNQPFPQISTADLTRSYAVNLFAPFHTIQHLLPLLEKAPAAHTVNISSMGGFQGASKFPGLSAYSSSKAAIASLTECLAEEFKDSSMKFNCLALGAVQTEMLEEAFPGYQAPVSATEMARFIVNFAVEGHLVFNGKVLPVALSNP